MLVSPGGAVVTTTSDQPKYSFSCSINEGSHVDKALHVDIRQTQLRDMYQLSDHLSSMALRARVAAVFSSMDFADNRPTVRPGQVSGHLTDALARDMCPGPWTLVEVRHPLRSKVG